eukprot:TRINITY_DN10935_c0_g1_i2.p1 TRINITY_DN10935_c0_g1~~TRINITY_DN10935_c0_g1_i2.p1  ORF type:complete len:154 (+),score=38.67 TRINITY_DN10935_c0_g1_i2:223-684(+)
MAVLQWLVGLVAVGVAAQQPEYVVHGGQNLACGPNPGVPDNYEVVSLQECITSCDDAPACVGFVTNTIANSRCFFRAEEAFAECQDQFGHKDGMEPDPRYDVYVKVGEGERIMGALAARRSSQQAGNAEERRLYLAETLGPADSNPALAEPGS